MASDYKKICQDNIRRRGEEFDDIGHLISEQLYSDRSHFVYELLQNAEDALERHFRQNPDNTFPCNVQFRLFQNRLEFRHFGEPFNEDDVRGISDVLKGTKKEDFAQIGKFGIGFKSVYAFTASPQIHSGEESFVVKRYIRPEAIKPDISMSDGETVFNFPFNHKVLSADYAFHLIFDKLRGLGPRVLLFLRRINEIEWSVEPDGETGQYQKEVRRYEKARRVTVIGQKNGQDEEENWLVFERPVPVPDGSYQVRVELGFRIETGTKEKTESITRIKDARLVVYFPTEKYTRFGFLIQGPYRTNPSRDNIPEDDEWNKTLVEETAKLVCDSLLDFKKMGLLSVPLLEAMPIRMEDFPENSMFYPIASRVREALMNEALLPADDGIFVVAQNAKLARGAELKELLNKDRLRSLFQSDDEIKWLAGTITPDLRTYLLTELDIEEITPDGFARRISSMFLEQQSDKWMILMYRFAAGRPKALWEPGSGYRNPAGPLRAKPIIRLQDGSHVAPFRDDGSPNAYLALDSDNETSLPIVKLELSQKKEACQFLRELGIPKLDLVAEVIEKVLPKYATDLSTVSSDEHKRDFIKIERAYATDSQEKKELLREQLCATPFILAENPYLGETVYLRPCEVYFGSDDLRMYFLGNNSFVYVSPEYAKSATALFKELGVKESVRIRREKSNKQGYVSIRDSHGWHERGRNGFDSNIYVDGLECAIANSIPERSAFVWNNIAVPNCACIRGLVEKSRRKTYENSNTEERISAKFGRLLIDNAWLPLSDRSMHKPSELTLDDLPPGFEKDTPRAEAFARAICMKQPEHEKALEVFAGDDPDLKMLVKHYQSASDAERKKMLKAIPREIPPEQAPSFKDGWKSLGRPQRGRVEHGDEERYPVSNPGRYQKKLNKGVEERVEEHQSTSRKIKFSPVRDQPSNEEARRFLYEQYHGRCQVKGVTFPKASENTDGVAENYFEACSLLSYANAGYLNDAGNMLCISADTMAKFKYASFEFLDNPEDVIKNFKVNNGQIEEISVRIRLAGEECAINWSQRHFMRLVALYEKA